MMTIREVAIAKIQQLPESLLQETNDFIDAITRQAADAPSQGAGSEAWIRWFEMTDRLEITPTPAPNEPQDEYQQHLLSKYQNQGLSL
jgi:hypothetical protein